MWILIGLTNPIVNLEKLCTKDLQEMCKNHFSKYTRLTWHELVACNFFFFFFLQ
jgi:hypothetical protein